MADYFGLPRPRVFGHRGAAGVAPENTLPSFALASALGAAYLELDVRGTRDGEVVVIHDETVDRTTDGNGRIADLSLAQVQGLDAGFRFTLDGERFPYRGQGVRIPRLAEVLAAFPEACFNIEIKQEEPDIVEDVVRILRAHGALPRTVLAAEKHPIMERIRAVAGDAVATGMSAVDVAEFIYAVREKRADSYRPRGRCLQIPPSFAGVELVTTESVSAAHAVGLEVHVWTINDPAEIEGLLRLGVDGVMSDLPGLVRVAADRHFRRG